jgi:xanthine dehydrogenase accessory factor
LKLEVLHRLNQARRERQAAILVTDLASGGVRLVVEREGYAGDPLQDELAARFASGASGMISGEAIFLTVQLPPPRLIVVGAVHISQALAPMAKVAGFDMTIVDPRTAFATPERFPEVAVLAEWPDVALPRLGLDAFTALAALTHDPKIDDGAIVAALAADCFYVGALGSRKTHGRRVERLREAGVGEAALARIRAPIGVAIGAQSPAEIAVAVLAEIIGALRSRGAGTKEAAA